ncbi:MAG: hypothetical protein LAO79_30280 [Acidobacteriia bacterium]|nr:hypothetical protein [Terriglobia bacterium]
MKAALRKILKTTRRGALLTLAYVWRRLMFRTRFIAITGSVGKTTTKDLTAGILGAMPAATISNFGSENTTREIASTLLRVRPWHRFAVLEVATARPGHIANSARMVAPDIAVVLSVARTHTNNFPTLEDTAAEKASLLNFVRKRGVAILNLDDPHVAAMKTRPGLRVVRFGCDARADIRGSGAGGHWPDRLSIFVTCRSGENAHLRSQLVGMHWTSALLAAAAIAIECGMPIEQIARGIAQVPPTLGRMDPQILPSGAIILRDEFNGSLDTYKSAFETLKAVRATRKILVITTVTDSPQSWDKRLKKIATEAAGVVDLLVLIGARDDTKRAGKAALAAGFSTSALHLFDDLPKAAEFLRTELRGGDVVLLRGKAEHHLTRLFYAQIRDVSCWLPVCPKRILCDHCPDLFAPQA